LKKIGSVAQLVEQRTEPLKSSTLWGFFGL